MDAGENSNDNRRVEWMRVGMLLGASRVMDALACSLVSEESTGP